MRRYRNSKYIYDYLATHPCVICWEARPVCLEFHHRDQTTKTFEPWIYRWRDLSIEKLQVEINKCDVVCSNCHKVLTSKQQNRYSYLNLPEFNAEKSTD